MEKTEKCAYGFLVVFVVWALGIFWHPFGYPNVYWHLILWVVMIGILIFGSVKKKTKHKKK